MTEYDEENVFAKILDGTAPCFKVFESKATLAFLDKFPVVPGHTLVITKLKGFQSYIEMPPNKGSEFLRDLHHVANAVKDATGAEGINIWNNNGQAAGQTVFHPHFHIIPRFSSADNDFPNYPVPSKEMLTEEVARPILLKIASELNPPKPLQKATFSQISNLSPISKGINLRVKILGEGEEVDGKALMFYEVLCGDSSGTVLLSLRQEQKDMCTVSSSITIRNAVVRMVKGHIRVEVNKWGKIEKIEDDADQVKDVDQSDDKNISNTEYELVKG